MDRAAMRQYKANLAVLSSRYGEIERRVLDNLATDPDAIGIMLPGAWYSSHKSTYVERPGDC